MRYVAPYIFIMLGILLIAPALYAAPDAKPAPKAIDAAPPVVKKFDASTPPAVGDEKPPGDVAGGIEQGKTLWQAIKDKAWWLVAASGVFIVMLIFQLVGLFKKMGKRWTWVVAGALSFVAALLLAFDKNGFSWNAFLAFCTAGPTIAWLRGFVKKAVLNFQKGSG